MNPDKLYPRTGDYQTIYLKNAVTNPNISVGSYTIYNDFENRPHRVLRKTMFYTSIP